MKQNSIFLSCGRGSVLCYTKLTIRARGKSRGFTTRKSEKSGGYEAENRRIIPTKSCAFQVEGKFKSLWRRKGARTG